MTKTTTLFLPFLISIVLLICVCQDVSASKESKPNPKLSKRNFTFQDAMKFESIPANKVRTSNDGSWLGFELLQDRGDINACLYATNDTNKIIIPNGKDIVFSNNALWAATTIQQPQREIENKTKNDSQFRLIELSTKKEFNFSNHINFEFSEDSKWLAYRTKTDKPKMEKFKDKDLGSVLRLRHLESKSEIVVDWVDRFEFDTLSNYLFYTVSSPDGNTDGIYFRELNKPFAPETPILITKDTYFGTFAWNEKHNQIAFLIAKLKDNGKPMDCSLQVATIGTDISNEIILCAREQKTEDTTKKEEISKTTKSKNKKEEPIVEDNPPNMIDSNWYLPTKNRLTWNKTRKLLYFGMKPTAERYDDKKRERKWTDSNFYNFDTLMNRAEVYVWGWDDPLIMTQQQKRWNRTKDKIYYAIYNNESKNVIQIGDTNLPDVEISKNDNFVIASNDKPYRQEQTWYGDCEDMYIVNLQNGNRTKIAERLDEEYYLTENGNYALFYKDKHWHLYDTKNNTTTNITQNVPTNFNNVFQDVPTVSYSNGFGGWLDDDKGFFIYDNWDVWYFETSNPTTYRNFTKQQGRNNNTVYRLRKLDRTKDYFSSNDTLLMTAINHTTIDAGLFTTKFSQTGNEIINEKIPMANSFFRDIRKPKESNSIILTQEKYNVFPNYYITDFSNNEPKIVTDINLNILDTFNWGWTKVVSWPYKDTTNKGYLVLPDNFDSTKKYPVFVYFYDQMATRANRFYNPQLTHRPANQIFMDNYIMFFCDVNYEVGRPGDDALESILAGCRYVSTLGYIDTNRACIQGHSWGGYQTAYIAMKPTFFKAACAGAPVANMTSAYSGIRLESGRTRQFQYEAQQSRIGGSIFDSLQSYIRNSPIFFANNSTTPLLIGFGDIDEAVPWEQGIELYMAMRRAQKPAWMLQYVDEPHWQQRYWNKLDYSVKMKEFFDHYCLDKPAPEWMTKGQPYKGENWGK